MALDISTIQNPRIYQTGGIQNSAGSAQTAAAAVAAAQNRAEERNSPPAPDMQGTLRSLEQVGVLLNRRLSFSLNQKLDSVVIKVIDTNTDKVVREVPPAEVQRVYERLREVVGQLLDKKA